MDKLADAMQSLIQKTGITVELTSEYCADPENVHPLNKEVQLMVIDSEMICPICEGQKATDQLARDIKAKHDYAKGRQAHSYLEKYSVLTDKTLLKATFSGYQVREPEEVANKERAVTAFQKYKEGYVFNTWLVGDPGVGKSHLAMSILKNLNEWGVKDRSCLFVSVDEMLLRIRSSFNDKESPFTESYFINLLTEADFLVLDDLGAETGAINTEKTATDFTLRVLYAIANGRQEKPTIITSNLPIKTLEEMYDLKLTSRLLRDMYVIKFAETKDKRIRNIDF